MTDPTQIATRRLFAEPTDVLVQMNATAGARSGHAIVERLIDLLRASGYSAAVFTELGPLADAARAAFERGSLRAVVAAGGDGTISAVAHFTPPGTPLLTLPLGTENLFAKFLGIRADAELLRQIVADGITVTLDAGQVNGRTFLLMVGCGFDAEVVRRLHRVRKGHIRHSSYIKPILDALRSYDYPQLRIYSALPDGTLPSEPTVVARWAFAVNLPRYAAGLPIAPQALGTDGLLDLCTFRNGSLWSTAAYAAAVARGVHQRREDCVTWRTPRVRIESEGEVHYQLDGDLGGPLPVEIAVLPNRLTMLVPKTWTVDH